jgi:hypothetical protein
MQEHPRDSTPVIYYSKVMLLAGSPVPTEKYSHREDRDRVHLCHKLKFLVERRDRSEFMCIGGEWDPALDGSDPVHNPQVLINTAIRTTKTATGLDLLPCTSWIKVCGYFACIVLVTLTHWL